MPRKPKTYAPAGNRCWRCGEIIPPNEIAIPRGLHDWCFACVTRPQQIVRIVERLQRQEGRVSA